MKDLHDSCSPDSRSLKGADPFNGEELSEAENAFLERTVWRKLDRWVLPFCTIFYFFSFLDRSNIANAWVAGMKTGLKMSNYQYSIALTMTYVPYIAAELPANLMLKYVGPRWMLPTMVTMWGIVAIMQGLVTTYSGLLACRFFLGLLEGGLFPGLVLCLSFFYPRDRMQIRIATIFASASLSGAFSGLLAAAIINMQGKGGKPGWAWIFILEGIVTVIFGCVSFIAFPNSPATAPFLSTKERAYVIARLKEDGAVAVDEKHDRFRWIEVLRSFKSIHVLILALIEFFIGTILYGLAYFEPTIVAGLGYTGTQAQLMSVPPFAVAFVVTMITAVISDRYGCRGFILMFFTLCSLIGFVIFYVCNSQHVRYGSLFLIICGSYCGAPTAITWLANNSAPHVRRATAIATGFIMTNMGGILATWLLGSLSSAPNYTKATVTFIIMSVGLFMLSSMNLAYLWHQNRLKAVTRQYMAQEDEPEDLGDKSAWFVYNL